MAHLHEVRDADTHFTIDAETMVITNTNAAKNKLRVGDHNSEVLTFEIPRYIENHDVLLCDKIGIHYMNAGTNKVDVSKDVYWVTDAAVSEEDENIVLFSWLVSGNATKYVGSLSFGIMFGCLEEDNTYSYVKNTEIFSGITISDGYNFTEAVVEQYSDVLEQWKKELSQLSEEKVDKQDGYSMVSDSEKQAWNNKSDFSGSYNDLTDKPEIPEGADLTGYATEDYVKDYAQPKGNYLTEHQDLSGYATEEFVENAIIENAFYKPIPIESIEPNSTGTLVYYNINIENLDENINYYFNPKEVADYPNARIHMGRVRLLCDDGSYASITNIPPNTKTTYYLEKPYDTKWNWISNNDEITIDFTDRSTSSKVVKTQNYNRYYLSIGNNAEYVPPTDYSPASKKYVDDLIAELEARITALEG